MRLFKLSPQLNKPLSRRDCLIFCLLSAFVWGIAAHGAALVTKFTFQDELTRLFSVGSTVPSGRWFLGVLGWCVRTFFGSPNFSIPLLGGLSVFLICGVNSFLIADLLELRCGIPLFLLTGLMVIFPSTTSLLFYNFTAPYYLIGMGLTIAGASILCRNRGIKAFCTGVLLVVLGTATYQSYISVFVCLLLLYFMWEILQAEDWTFSKLVKEVLWYCGACIAMLLVYLLSVKVSNALCGTELVNYRGISSMGKITVGELLKRAKLAVYLFLFPKKSPPEAYLFPYRMIDCYYLCLAGLAVLGSISVVLAFQASPLKGLSLLLAFGVFPLATNFIYVMCDSVEVYTLMQAAEMMPFLLLLWIASKWNVFKQFPAQKLAVILLSVFCIFTVRVDNATYEKAELTQTRIRQYFTVMIAQIHNTPGYTAETPVAYIVTPDTYGDPTFHQIEGFAELPIAPLRYASTPFCVGNTWEALLDLCCGFAPPTVDAQKYADLPQVQEMPCYPDYGSIQMIDGTLVVKMN